MELKGYSDDQFYSTDESVQPDGHSNPSGPAAADDESTGGGTFKRTPLDLSSRGECSRVSSASSSAADGRDVAPTVAAGSADGSDDVGSDARAGEVENGFDTRTTGKVKLYRL